VDMYGEKSPSWPQKLAIVSAELAPFLGYERRTKRLVRSLVLPGVTEVIAEPRDTSLAECDYIAERGWQERFAGFYAGHPSITVLTVHDAWCSDRVLVTTSPRALRSLR
jgi:hypothetical protein